MAPVEVSKVRMENEATHPVHSTIAYRSGKQAGGLSEQQIFNPKS
jgi:hypothetical protein